MSSNQKSAGGREATDSALQSGKRNLRDDQYGAGCAEGHRLALEWLAHPSRGDASYGGTLQHVMLDLAGQLAAAQSPGAHDRARGAIVGFCALVELPEMATACHYKARSRNRVERSAA